jgi:hypothetical protein
VVTHNPALAALGSIGRDHFCAEVLHRLYPSITTYTSTGRPRLMRLKGADMIARGNAPGTTPPIFPQTLKEFHKHTSPVHWGGGYGPFHHRTGVARRVPDFRTPDNAELDLQALARGKGLRSATQN